MPEARTKWPGLSLAFLLVRLLAKGLKMCENVFNQTKRGARQ
jgi:hypothetical protein